MTQIAPTLAARARGTLLGLAAGNALGVPTEFLGTPESIRERFPGGLTDVLPSHSDASPHDDDTAMTLIQAEELLDPEPDLRRVARRWIDWARADGRGIGVWTRRALDHIAQYDAPPSDSGGQAGNGSLARCMPVALATFRSPQALVGATYHTAALLHPDERCVWGAVAVNVALARFLLGKRDFIPDVIEALRNNDAPAVLLEAVRRVPIGRREALPVTGPAAGYVVHCVEIALWCAYHEPAPERALVWLINAGGDTDSNAAVAGALLGARDGEAAIPRRWIEAVPDWEGIGVLAERLVGGR
jgi:ADP-ribosyl-[dinitrogen reductase] hydrolase